MSFDIINNFTNNSYNRKRITLAHCFKSIYCINSETTSLVEIDKKNGICIVETLDHSLGKNDCKYNKREINSRYFKSSIKR